MSVAGSFAGLLTDEAIRSAGGRRTCWQVRRLLAPASRPYVSDRGSDTVRRRAADVLASPAPTRARQRTLRSFNPQPLRSAPRFWSLLPVLREKVRMRVISSTNGTGIPNHPHASPLPEYRERGPEAVCGWRCVSIEQRSNCWRLTRFDRLGPHLVRREGTKDILQFPR